MSNPASGRSTAATRDEFFDALADARRRTALRLVHRQSPDAVGKSELARHLAAVTMDNRSAEVTDDDYRQALVDVHHRLMPSLTDAGLLEETDDEMIVLGDHPAFDDPHLEEIVSVRHDGDDATLDAVFRALAAERRRTVLSILAEEDRSLETETLARRVAARDAETIEREVAQDRVDEVLTSFVHIHGPTLADASLVEYDAETGQVADTAQPAVRAEWIRPADAVATDTDESVTIERRADGNTPATHRLIYRAQPRSP